MSKKKYIISINLKRMDSKKKLLAILLILIVVGPALILYLYKKPASTTDSQDHGESSTTDSQDHGESIEAEVMPPDYEEPVQPPRPPLAQPYIQPTQPSLPSARNGWPSNTKWNIYGWRTEDQVGKDEDTVRQLCNNNCKNRQEKFDFYTFNPPPNGDNGCGCSKSYVSPPNLAGLSLTNKEHTAKTRRVVK